MSDFIDLKEVRMEDGQSLSSLIRSIVARLGTQEFSQAHIKAIVRQYPEYERLKNYKTSDRLIVEALRDMLAKGTLVRTRKDGVRNFYKAVSA